MMAGMPEQLHEGFVDEKGGGEGLGCRGGVVDFDSGFEHFDSASEQREDASQ